MKYSIFEELPVWNAAIEFALKVFAFTSKADFRELGDTKNQLERSALSISNNIAEGFERGTTTELIHFLYIARGSAGESRSMLRLCESIAKFSNFKSEISNLIGSAINISKQLHGWIDSLKNTDIKGVKFFTNKEKKRVETDKEFEEFDRTMERYRQELLEKITPKIQVADRS
ncbi:MAG: four helix bundle protein [Pyrinomonadaceae bacterium]